MLADHEARGDLAVAPPGRDEAQDFDLALGEPVRPGGRGSPEKRVDARQVRACPQPREDLARGLELQHGGVLVPQRPAGQADGHAGARGLVRSAELVPDAQRVTQGGQRALRVAVGQRHDSARRRGLGTEGVAAVRGRDLPELAARAARSLPVPDGEHDLDAGRQEPCTRQRLRRLVHDATDRAGRGPRLALRQAQKGEARLRLVPAPGRAPVGLLGGGELPPQPMDLALPIEGLAAGQLVEDAVGEALGCPPGLVQGLVPGALELPDLGPVHEAEAVVGHHLGLALAPAGERVGPLPGMA